MAQSKEFNIRVVFYQEDDFWIAQCLEYDIGTQAKTFAEAQASFERTFAAEIQYSARKGEATFASIEAAPAHFHELWDGKPGSPAPVDVAQRIAVDGYFYDSRMSA
jgi:hypothetical protein